MMDLFNTLGRKREKGFIVTCEALTREHVDTVEKAEACRRQLHRNGVTYVSFVLLVGLSLAMLLSSFTLPVLVGMTILLLYIITSTYRAKQHVLRYIKDILNRDEGDANADLHR
ncbi:MAG: hypothetical protein ACI8VC_002757 [Candidatus Endobugula sp.]|jgi:hypothetical protein